MNIRSKILIWACKLFTLPKGDAELNDINCEYDISCVINFYGRPRLLENTLFCLASQDLSKERFEVVLVEDRGGTIEGEEIAKRFGVVLDIKYFKIQDNFSKLGFSRNLGLSKAKGRYVLFLDDDTVILQNNFLSVLIDEFHTSKAETIVPFGSASYCLRQKKYDFHDPYFPANRCIAYSRESLKDLGGFVSDVIGQEDVEFIIRFLASGRKFHNSTRLHYLHPPFILNNLNKAFAVGISFARLKKRYPFIIWMMILLNGSRYAPLMIMPFNKKWKTQAKFSIGFLIGAIYSITGKTLDCKYEDSETPLSI